MPVRKRSLDKIPNATLFVIGENTHPITRAFTNGKLKNVVNIATRTRRCGYYSKVLENVMTTELFSVRAIFMDMKYC